MSNIARLFKLAGNVGDQVVLDLQGRDLKGVSDGETVTIIEFAERYSGRTDGIGVPPGLWKNYSYSTVRDARGNDHDIHSSHLLPLPGSDYIGLPRQLVGDLPETPFWEGDVVEVYDGRKGVVSVIDYGEIDTESDEPPYRVSFPATGGGEGFHAHALSLIERGDVWRHYHGEEIDFESAADEATLHHTLSLVTSVANRETRSFGFSWGEAVQALRNGDADVIVHNWTVITDDPGRNVQCYSIDDAAAGERCRAAFLGQIDMQDAPAY